MFSTLEFIFSTNRSTKQEEYDFEAFENAYAHVETVITTAETQTGSNGVIEIVDQQRITEQGPSDVVNGIHPDGQLPAQEQQQQQQQMLAAIPEQPVLFDMDLERMHVDLYKGKYLTPHEFLDDVGKIVHNADVMMNEDPDRLYKAQAMFTATEVSIHEFDPGLRLECERMAPRERQRREEFRKSKGKGKPKADDAIHPVGTRRSARHNGQQPELSITDPLKLERKLKRQRSNEEGADSHASSEDDRGAKRSKMSVTDDDDRDPLDVVGPESTQRPATVRFANDVQNIQGHGDQETPMVGQEQYEPQFPPSPTPRKTAGFDAFLLNPAPLAQPDYSTAPPLPSLMDTIAQASPPSIPVPSTSFQPMDTQPLAQNPVAQASCSPIPVHSEPLPSQSTSEVPPDHQPMIIERTPTPPPPDFHVNDDLLHSLQSGLRDTTGALNVEQLEQLRATCLGCVWRHRTEWDRDSLVRELKDVVKEFVDEVAEDALDSPLGD